MVVINTGAYVCIPLFENDFKGPICSIPSDQTIIRGLMEDTSFIGEGMVCCHTTNDKGHSQHIKVPYFLLRKATLCLLSPQLWFQHHQWATSPSIIIVPPWNFCKVVSCLYDTMTRIFPFWQLSSRERRTLKTICIPNQDAIWFYGSTEQIPGIKSKPQPWQCPKGALGSPLQNGTSWEGASSADDQAREVDGLQW